ncbi:MAG: gamma-glutamyltransferase family protein [Phycisphaerales bacterium]
MDLNALPYPSRRVPVCARNMVACSQPLAGQAGLAMLARGGSAVDAIVAMASTLTLVEPTGNGIGSDAFALVWDGQSLHGLNASGRSPAALRADDFAGRDAMPTLGWAPVTVPGCVDAWRTLHEQFGTLDFADVLAPAIAYARDGFPVSPITGRLWQSVTRRYAEFPSFLETFAPQGRPPRPGEMFQSSGHADTLQDIAETRGESFYRGRLARAICDAARAGGGAMREDDLASHKSEWVVPLAQDFAGVTLHEIPPSGQGIAALIALGILDRLDIARFPVDSPDSVHLQVEAMKIAFAEISRHVADPRFMEVEPHAMLAPEFLDRRAAEVRLDAAQHYTSRVATDHGTVYLAAADARGMMVSYIQSNYMGFGSGIVPPGTGISMQNRGACFVTTPGHPNQVAGGKKPYHTIIPAFVTRGGKPLMAFGVMGGHMQPQGHLQMVVRMFVHDQNPQAASDAPRWQCDPSGRLLLERGFDAAVAAELTRRGHDVATDVGELSFGGAQLILNHTPEAGNVYVGGSDHRKDGHAAGF